jgi:adenosylmethionine-8-amino-7-oxononanoate aminotransferase
MDNGLVLYPTTGGVNDALLVAPPLTVTAAEVDLLLERLAASL